jgi:hypothetical protein
MSRDRARAGLLLFAPVHPRGRGQGEGGRELNLNFRFCALDPFLPFKPVPMIGRNAQIAVGARRLGERAKSTLSRPSHLSYEQGVCTT